MTPTEHPLRARLRAQAEHHRGELAGVTGLAPETYATLVRRAEQVERALEALGCGAEAMGAVADERRVLADVAGQLSGSGGGIPPPNGVVYAAAVNIVELDSIAASLSGAGERWAAAVRSHASGGTSVSRLALLTASLLRRAGMRPALARAEEPGSMTVDLGGWEIGFAFGVCGPDAGVGSAAEAGGRLRATRRPGMIVLEAGAAMPSEGLVRGASDAAVLASLGGRLERWILAERGAIAGAVDVDHAFAVVAHATLAGLNAASGRLIFAECWRVANLCGVDDPRVDRLKPFMSAIGRADVTALRRT